MELPLELKTAIEDQLALMPVKDLSELATRLSEDYRSSRPLERASYIGTREDALAYAAFRLPATFAAAYFAMAQVKERLPDLNPRSFLDVGAGPGTAMWAATMVWPQLERITCVEREQHMMEMGKKLAKYSNLPSIKQAQWIKADVTFELSVPPHDVVMASYVLNELPRKDIESFALRLWESAAQLLIFIEPGTPAGFSLIRRVRERLLLRGANVIAPCPHNNSCPIAGDDWCHFSQRLARSRLHRQIKGGTLSYEDEKFSFVCLSRTPGTGVKGVVVRHPQIRKGHIYLKLCTPEGVEDTVVTRKDKGKFKEARKLEWGSVVR